LLNYFNRIILTLGQLAKIDFMRYDVSQLCYIESIIYLTKSKYNNKN